jgi:hypothetical protein
VTETTHPAWCDPSRCTAPATRPTRDEYQGSAKDRREHRSADVESTFLDGVAYLTQAVAPWETSVYLRVEIKDCARSFSTELAPESPLLLMARQVVAEQQQRYPTLVPPLDAAAEPPR